MDPRLFTNYRTGELVKVGYSIEPTEDWAFIPVPLPPGWQFPVELWPLLGEAKQKLGELNGIGRMLPNPTLLMQPLSRREALYSSSLEGTYATPEQLLLFELNPENVSPDTTESREVHNYDQALKMGFTIFKEHNFDLMNIRQLHHRLLSNVRGEDKDPGKIRGCQLHIGSNRRFIPPPPYAVTNCLDQFIDYIKSPSPAYDPLINAFMAHYQFEAIHPFKDGNGRLGRVLLSLMICKWCGHSLPWLYMSAYFEKYKNEYFDKLFNISANGEWGNWIEFCLRGAILQSADSIRRCELLVQLKEKFHARINVSAPRLHPLIDKLFENPVIQIANVKKEYAISYPTAQSDIDKLIQAGILTQLQPIFPKTYFAPEILRIAYQE